MVELKLCVVLLSLVYLVAFPLFSVDIESNILAGRVSDKHSQGEKYNLEGKKLRERFSFWVGQST